MELLSIHLFIFIYMLISIVRLYVICNVYLKEFSINAQINLEFSYVFHLISIAAFVCMFTKQTKNRKPKKGYLIMYLAGSTRLQTWCKGEAATALQGSNGYHASRAIHRNGYSNSNHGRKSNIKRFERP